MVREKSDSLESAAQESGAGAADFGRYQLLKKLAAGGMAEVYLARQSGLEGFEKLIVVKRILPHLATDEEFVQMFLNEARIAARFNHANIVQIYDLGKTDGTYYIGMEYVHGEDVSRIMRKAWNAGTWIAPQLALRVIAQACEGLYYAHTKADDSGRPLNVVHRDISPQNILVSFDGGVKIVDFGIAKAADSSSGTRNGTIKGKYAYMSPEQAQGKPVDARTDVFALGLVLYELLTGVRPLKRDHDIQTLQAALACEIDPPSTVASISDTLDPLVMMALQRDTSKRYASARDFQLAIEDYLVQNQLAASSVHLSEFMKTLFADRLEEEAQAGRPMPSASVSQQSFPAIPMPKGTGPVPPMPPRSDDLSDVPQQRKSTGTENRKLRAPPLPAPASAIAEVLEEDGDDGPTSQDLQPRRKSGQVKRVTGEVPARRITGESPRRPSAQAIPASRTPARSRVTSQVAGGMPDAPPRKTGEVRRDDSWKDANLPDPRGGRGGGRSALPAVVTIFLVAVGAGLLYRGELVKFLGSHGVQVQPVVGSGGDPKALGGTMVNLGTNIPVEVEINGEVIGRTPIRNYPVRPGSVAVHYFNPERGIDRTESYTVAEDETFSKHIDFEITQVQFRTEKAQTADIYVNGKKIGSTGSRMQLACGEYDFEARADNDTLVGTAHGILVKDKVNFVDFHLHRK